MRQNICNIVNEMSEMDARQRREAGAGGNLDFDLKKCYHIILQNCIQNGTHATPRKNTFAMKDGCLFINGLLAGRVAPFFWPPFRSYDPRADYYEGRILARQEEV